MTSLKAKKNLYPDLPTYKQAMHGPYDQEFLDAIALEIDQLWKHGTWRQVKIGSLPEGTQVMPTTWVFIIKQFPNQAISKFKPRFFIRGDRQEEVYEAFAPVVGWSTIRSVLAFALQNELKTKQADFCYEFVQATMPEDEKVFIAPPREFFPNKNVVFQLIKSQYGLRSAPFHWLHKIKESLGKHGFVPSKVDQCLFLHPTNGMILLLYCDDIIVVHKDMDKIDELLTGLRKEYALTEEQVESSEGRNVYSYLGIEVEMEKNGTNVKEIILKQQGLIKKILKETNMQECNTKDTSANEKVLGSNQAGDPFKERWDYASVVGMLMYLVNTRPDIQFAVH